MPFKKHPESENQRLFYVATISLALHAFMLGAFWLFPSGSTERSRPVEIPLPVLQTSLVSWSKIARNEQAGRVDSVRESQRKQKDAWRTETKDSGSTDHLSALPERTTILSPPSQGVTTVQIPALLDFGASGGRASLVSATSSDRNSLREKSAGAPISHVLPRYRLAPRPVYPSYARERGYEGIVLLSAAVGTDGRVGVVRVKRTSGFAILDQAALAAVKTWLFDPAKKDNVTVSMLVDIPLKFSLNDPE